MTRYIAVLNACGNLSKENGQCGLEFDIDLCDDADYTRNEAVDPDRLPQPRGDTPLRDDGHILSRLRPRRDPLDVRNLNLEFDAENGIAAWADEDLYGDYAGPLMQKGDFWKIMLGRRIQLEEDDPDGSLFIEALLEDALIFPTKRGPWETVEESPGIWVTRPVYDQPGNPSASASDSGGQQSQSQQDDKLKADYVAPVFAVAAHGYETDAESDEEMIAWP
ncbi:hypothetical protein B0H14DRAFT_3423752 [Mycena olivaceomarginata]|nr:hypothetical protein B0H14DRAFT_3423752 [Mycena olivaceomarginata]